MKCKNIECENKTTGKRVYCSLTCRNIFVNKHLRSYEKVSETFQKKKKNREEDYLKSPNLCKACNEVIDFSKVNDNEGFCDRSCAVSYSNRKRKGIKYSLSVGGLEVLRQSAYRNFGLNKVDKVTKSCINCDVKYVNKNKSFCKKNCKIEYDKKNTDEYQGYRRDTNFKFNLADYSEEFDFSLIEKYGWYSPSNKNDNLDGVSRDHLLSVREGFEIGIDPKLIAHPANCRLIKHTDNISKNKKSIITYNGLLERIEVFEKKYGKYYK